MGRDSLSTKTLSALVFALGAAPLAKAATSYAADVKVQNLELQSESKVTYEQLRGLLGSPENRGINSSFVSSGNYASFVSSGNYADFISEANYSDFLSAGNYANFVSEANYGRAPADDAALEESMPAPRLKDRN